MQVEHEAGPGVISDRDPAGGPPDHPRDEGDRVVGLVPGHDLEELRTPRATRGASSRGTTSCDSARARQHQHRQAFERHRLVAGEVRQVGTDGEQQHVDAELDHAGPDARDAVGELMRRSRAGRRCSTRSSSPSSRRSPSSPFVVGPFEEPVAVVDEIHERNRVPARRRDLIDRDVDDRSPARRDRGTRARARRTPASRPGAPSPRP